MAGPPQEPYEREAEQVASSAMRRLRTGSGPETGSGSSSAAQPAASDTHSATSGGRPLPEPVRHRLGQSLGADLSAVRVHTDARADRLNRSLDSNAATVGGNIFFRHGEYRPESRAGQELIAHEAVHTVHQGAVEQSGGGDAGTAIGLRQSPLCGPQRSGNKRWRRRGPKVAQDAGSAERADPVVAPSTTMAGAAREAAAESKDDEAEAQAAGASASGAGASSMLAEVPSSGIHTTPSSIAEAAGSGGTAAAAAAARPVGKRVSYEASGDASYPLHHLAQRIGAGERFDDVQVGMYEGPAHGALMPGTDENLAKLQGLVEGQGGQLRPNFDRDARDVESDSEYDEVHVRNIMAVDKRGGSDTSVAANEELTQRVIAQQARKLKAGGQLHFGASGRPFFRPDRRGQEAYHYDHDQDRSGGDPVNVAAIAVRAGLRYQGGYADRDPVKKNEGARDVGVYGTFTKVFQAPGGADASRPSPGTRGGGGRASGYRGPRGRGAPPAVRGGFDGRGRGSRGGYRPPPPSSFGGRGRGFRGRYPPAPRGGFAGRGDGGRGGFPGRGGSRR